MENVYLIVGLGNPGREYARTRHNAGFAVVERLAERWAASWSNEKRFRARLARVDRAENRFFLCLPETYMNSSGQAVAAVSHYYHAPLDRLLVVLDDADLNLGTIRLRPNGSSGGHHGLESLERELGSRDFARQRIGIGRRTDGVRQIADYVLSPFQRDEMELVENVLARACDQIECWASEGIAQAMNRYNGVVK